MISFGELTQSKLGQAKAADAEPQPQAPAPEPTKPSPGRTFLTDAQKAERALLCYEMIRANRPVRDIVRACVQEFGAGPSTTMMAEIRRGTYLGPGYAQMRSGSAHTADVAPVLVQGPEMMALRKTFDVCQKAMQQAGVVYAHINAQTGEVKLEIQATQTWHLGK